jgi:uncharacterized cupin superfamily protein
MATIRIDTAARPPLDQPIAAEKCVAGRPSTGFVAAHDDEARGFWSGVWASEVGAWRVAYDEIELCVILEGRVRLTGDDGSEATYGPGDAFVLPKGFTGVWETLEPLRKIYAIVA